MSTLRAIGLASVTGFTLTIASLATLAAVKYPGSPGIFSFFSACFFSLIILIAPRSRHYGYAFFATFLFLGFWTKTAIQVIWAPAFLEPVGDFAGAPQAWDNALMAAACGALGLVAARVAHLLVTRRNLSRDTIDVTHTVPLWYPANKRLIWAFSIVVILALNTANYYYAFYKIGVIPLFILPLHLNVIASWLINIGFAMWLATLVFWDINHKPRVIPNSLPMPLFEAFLSSTSAMSRGIFLFHALPYFVALAANSRGSGAKNYRLILRTVALWLIALFLLSLSIVFWLRMPSVHGPDVQLAPAADVMRTYRKDVTTQLPVLLAQRWVGLEGVLAVEAAQNRGRDLFSLVIADSAKNGADSIYQKIAKVDYNRDDPGKHYLSNAGVIAILYTSNSLFIVFSGMAMLGLILAVSEALAHCWTGNFILTSLSGAGLANVMAQTTFPYLTLIFIIQLWITIGILGSFSRLNFNIPGVKKSA